MKRSRKIIASLALAALPLVGLVGVGVASAQPNNGAGGASGCAVEDEHGNVTYVPVGTVIGLFHCGSDGEWHFGTVTTDRVSTPTGPKAPAKPPRTVGARVARR